MIFRNKRYPLRFFVALLICVLTGAEVDLCTPSFPELSKVFDLTPFMVQLILSLNFVAYCICCLFTGALSDRYGQRFVIFFGLSIFVAGSFLCIVSTSFTMLLFGRFLQGMGIAGPAFLGYVLVLEDCPIREQPKRLAFLEGIITFALIFSPIVGSYINFYFSWRANFAALLILGLFCLIIAFWAIPTRQRKNTVISLSLRAYRPLLRSQKIWIFVLALCFLEIPYWVFSGISPLLYIEDMGISVKGFGYYQGAVSLVYSIFCLSSSQLFKWVGYKRCLYVGVTLSGVGAFFLLTLSILSIQVPYLVTGGILFLIGGTVLPINILYPLALSIFKESKNRIAALLLCIRLILTAFFLEGVGFFYKGKLFPLGIALGMFFLVSLFLMHRLINQNWLRRMEE